MSIEAINWAMRQRLRGCAPQCLLFVLANAADPEGVAFGWWKSADHWWPYLIKHTRLARATIFNLLRELEEDGLLTRDQVAPDAGGSPQPVIRLHFDKLVDEPMPSERRARPTDTDESESITWTQESAGEAEKAPPSPPNGLENDGLAGVVVHPMDSFESTPWTTQESYTENPITPQPPEQSRATAKGPAKEESEPIGFATFWQQYPDHETDNRKKAASAFTALSDKDRSAAVERVSLYAAQIAKTGRRPVGAWRWLADRRFAEYAPGARTGVTPRWFVPEGSDPWKAACALAAVAFGTTPRIPQFWGASGGANVPIALMENWQPWLVPYDRWPFVERGTPQYGRWIERMREMIDRAPVLVHVGRSDVARRRQHRLIGVHADEWNERDYDGLMVPLEWPPARHPKPASAPLLTEADHDELAHL